MRNYAAWHKEVLAERVKVADAAELDAIEAALLANGSSPEGMMCRLVGLRKQELAGEVDASAVADHAFAVVHGTTALAASKSDPAFRAAKDEVLAATLAVLAPQYTEGE